MLLLVHKKDGLVGSLQNPCSEAKQSVFSNEGLEEICTTFYSKLYGVLEDHEEQYPKSWILLHKNS